MARYTEPSFLTTTTLLARTSMGATPPQQILKNLTHPEGTTVRLRNGKDSEFGASAHQRPRSPKFAKVKNTALTH